MHFSLLLLALAASHAPADTLNENVQAEYKGEFTPVKGDPGLGDKEFQFSVLIRPSGPLGTRLYWTLDEQGSGGWSWLSRFGRIDLGPGGKVADGVEGPALLHERAAGTSVVPLVLPLKSATQPLAKGTRWTEGKLRYQVIGETRVAGVECWKIDVRNDYGHQRVLVRAKESPLVLAVDATVVIGQGERHKLRYELTALTSLSPDTADQLVNNFEALAALREKLGFEPQSREFRWSPERLALLRDASPGITETITTGPLADVAKAATRDAKRQADRSSAIGAYRKRIVGTAAPRPALETLDSRPFDWDSTKGKVTVLHFWQYRDEPLEEPYGQVAYLDFLYRQRKSEKLAVFGVAVDGRLADPSTRRRAISSAKKLKSFMNLSYPLLLDSGAALREVGDPRTTGAKLPLFVVIDPDGKVTHYHVGNYEVDRDRGIKELDDEVTKAAKGETGE